MKKIAIFTTTRAEFGILKPLIIKLINEPIFEPFLFVGGTHLVEKFGMTINEIKNSEIQIADTFDFILNADTKYNFSKSLAVESFELSRIFNTFDFDAICVLGDRIELLPIVQTAILFNKLIIHIHGGESSEGAIDEQIRHMITKAAHIHFAACQQYAQNIINMGEQKFRVFNTGALATDNMANLNIIPKNILYQTFKLNLNKPLIIMTYHPVTLEKSISAKQQILNIFEALKSFDIQVIITSPNVDTNYSEIIEIILQNTNQNSDYKFVNSLGVNNFHNLLLNCDLMLGNSSSGIIEVPFFKKPTVNIGNRQKGRIMHKSILNADYSVNSIEQAINKAMSDDFVKEISTMDYLFGHGNTANQIVSILTEIDFEDIKYRQKQLTFIQ